MTVRKFSRRGFLELGAAAGAAVLAASQRVHAAGSDVLKIGLVGCGNRGRGSLLDSLAAMPNVRVVALGDLFREKAVATRAAIAASDVGKGRIDVPDDRIFTGFDSYKGVIAESDIVHIALPSRFHPPYNLAAVQAGKHAFTEKPNGIDADGVHVTIQAAKIAEEKKLANVSGLCYRYDLLRLQSDRADLQRRDRRVWPRGPTTCERRTTSFRRSRNGRKRVSNSQLGTFHVAQRRRNPAVAPAQSRLRPVGGWRMSCRRPATRLGGRSARFQPGSGRLVRPRIGDLRLRRRQTYLWCDPDRREAATSNIDVFHGTKGRMVFRASPEFRL